MANTPTQFPARIPALDSRGLFVSRWVNWFIDVYNRVILSEGGIGKGRQL